MDNESTGTETGEATVAEPKTEKKAKKRTNRLSEDLLVAEYPHVKRGTLHFLPNENKQAVTISCTFVDEETGDVCGKEREVRTSDLFQVSKCEVCTIKARRAKAKARRAAKKAEAAEADAGDAGDEG
jgi:hypothetical protein